MFGIGNRDHLQRELLEPPYPVDVVADLHAGVYPDDVAKLLKPRVLADPDAAAIWAALEATTAQLALPVSPIQIPPFAQERIDQTLTALAESDRGGAQVTWLSRRRGVVAASLAAAAVVGIAVAATFAFTADSGDSERAPVATETAAPDTPAPTTLSSATLLSVLGSNDGGGFVDRAAQEQCLLANQVPPSTPVLGTGSIDDAGGRAVVILLSTGTIGTFDALVVGPDCSTGNPATISRTTIGDK